MKQSAYQQNLIKTRQITNAEIQAMAKRSKVILEKAYRDLTNLIDLSGTGTATQANYLAKRTSIKALIDRLTMDLNVTARLAIRGNAENIVDIYAAVTNKYAGAKGFKGMADVFSTVPALAVNNVINRVWLDGRNFSDRIWELNNYTSNAVNEIISSGIARGQSATRMAKDLQDFLLEPAITDNLSYTMAGLKSVTGRGTVNYNALRLAATEINNSYRESLAIANDVNPITDGLLWNLSQRHIQSGYYDVCNIWATVDGYGKGKGVFPADKVPIDHPGGRCFLTEVLREVSQWGKPKPEYSLRDLSDKEILSAFEGKEDMSKAQKIAALDMFESTNVLVNKRIRKAA